MEMTTGSSSTMQETTATFKTMFPTKITRKSGTIQWILNKIRMGEGFEGENRVAEVL